MVSGALAFLAFGLLILMVTWLPLLTRNIPFSLPALAVVIGLLGGWAMGAEQLAQRHGLITEGLTNVVLVIAIMGAGLKIDRPFAWRTWGSAWRLLFGVMPLTILGVAACGIWLLKMPLGEAILLAAILAPTDPVLAGEVQLGPPGVGEEGEERFSLTAEGGLNDGLAFPFVLLGLTLLTGGGDLAAALPRWLAVDVVWKIAGAVGVGLLFGVGLIRLNQHLPEHLRLSRSHDGIVSLGVTFIAYGLADLIDAYGFVAVFVAAVAIRNTEDKVEYTRQIYDFSAEVERLAVMVLLILFGAAIASGLFSDLRAADAVYVVVALFVVRPLAALLSFAGSRHPMPMRLATGMLGVRGVASLYYVAYAFNRADLADAAHMRSLVALVVLLSIVVFGIAAEPAMRYLERLDPQTR